MTTSGELSAGWAMARIDELAIVNPARERVNCEADMPTIFVPMSAVEEEFGGVDTSMLRPFSEVQEGYTQFKNGDIIFAKITPCMENGKVGVVGGVAGDRAYGSTEFHVLRPASGVRAKWIANYLSQRDFRSGARRNMTGTAGQLRVPKKWLSEHLVPLAPTAEQERINDKVDELTSVLDAGIAGVARVEANLVAYKASLLKAGVEGKLTANWREEHPDAEPGLVS